MINSWKGFFSTGSSFFGFVIGLSGVSISFFITTLEVELLSELPLFILITFSGLVSFISSEFDLVVANIITSELSLLAKYIEKKIKKNGYLVLSGILDYQSKIIFSKFRNFNIIL